MDDDYKAKNPQKPTDDDTPFSQPDDVKDSRLDNTHPATDTNMDIDETYQEGLGQAANVDDPEDADEFNLQGDSH